MRLIQARVSEDLFKAFSHYCVEHDWTVAECVGGWIEIHCGKNGETVDRGETVKVGATPHPKPKPPVAPVAPQKQPVSEFACKVCGKPTDGAYVCKGCVDKQKNQQ